MRDDHAELRAEHERLSELVERADEAYHSGSDPILHDDEYNPVKRRLLAIEAELPSLREGSPTGAVGAKPRGGLGKVRHSVRMISLDNAFTPDDVHAFVARVAKATGVAVPRFVGEPKIDGLSLGVRYEGGRMVVAATRGDSEVGEDVTANARLIPDVPATIPYKGEVEVRGEAYMARSDFRSLNERQLAAGAKLFANPRNAAAGALRNTDAAKARSRPLRMFSYSIVGGPAVASQEELLATLQSWGFSISELVGICEGADELLAYHADVVAHRPTIDYDLDGVVYKLDDVQERVSMGETSRTPRWAIAHKFEAEKAVTRLNDIGVQVGRTGVLTPVAWLEPVSVGGVVVSRATLHNAQEVARKDVRVGDMVTVQRAGDVIPQVLGHVAGTRDPASPAWAMPTHCPSCGSEAVQVPGEVAIRCRAAFSCPAQKAERLRHMASRDVLDIDGLGDKNVELLVGAGILDRPGDVFRIPAAEARIAALPGMGKRSAAILAASVEGRRGAPLDRFIAALGMREVGGATAKLLAAHAVSAKAFLRDCKAMADGDEATVKAYRGIDQVGPAVTDAISEHFSEPRTASDAEDLAAQMRVPDYAVGTGPFKGMTIVFTGTLERTDRNGAKAQAEALGAKVAGSVSKKTSLLVAGPGAGGKLADAEKHKVRVVDEDGWLALVAEAAGAA